MSLNNPRNIALVVSVLVAVLVISMIAIRLYNARTYHFVEVDRGKLFRDGMRRPEQFVASCRKGRIRTVISLIGDDEIVSSRFAPAIAQCRAVGINTLQVAIPLGGWPATADVQRFLELARDKGNQPILVHCREGVRRTGMMVSAYRISVMGMTKEQAKAALETFGHSRRSIGDVEQFIDAYDPVTCGVHYARQPTTSPLAE